MSNPKTNIETVELMEKITQLEDFKDNLQVL